MTAGETTLHSRATALGSTVAVRGRNVRHFIPTGVQVLNPFQPRITPAHTVQRCAQVGTPIGPAVDRG